MMDTKGGYKHLKENYGAHGDRKQSLCKACKYCKCIAGAGADILRLKGEMYNTERVDLK